MFATHSIGRRGTGLGRSGALAAGLLSLLAGCQDAVAPRPEQGAGGADGGARANTLAGAPTADVTAGARSLPDLAFASGTSGKGCTRWATEDGDDNNAGTWEAPYRNVSKLLGVLKAGEVGCVLPGNYPVTGGTTANAGDPDKPIVLLGGINFSDHYSTVSASAGTTALTIDKPYWIVDGFELRSTGANAVRVKSTAHHVIVSRNQVFNSGFGAAVGIAGQDVAFQSNQIFPGAHADPALDSHAVVITPGAQRVAVRSNQVYPGFTGDGVQCQTGGSEALSATLPTDITLDWNIVEGRQDDGTAVGENAIDVKTCQYVTISNGTYSGFRPTRKSSSNTSQGEAIVLHYNARYVRLENNRITDSCVGLGVGRGEDAASLTQDVVIRRNAIYNLPSGTDPATQIVCKGDGIVLSRVHRADVYHNTLAGIPRRAVQVAWDNTVDAMPGVELWNNIVHDATDWLYVNADRVSGFAASNNLYSDPGDTDLRNIVVSSGGTSARMTLATWQAKTFAGAASVAVADPNSFVGDPLLAAETSTTPQWWELRLSSGSPARNAGLANTGTVPDGLPDLGWKEGS